jgi:hypothetical protein
MTRRRIVLYRIAALLCLASAAAVLASVGLGATAANLRTLGFGYGDSVYNYDFTSESVSSTGVDWGVSLLFYDNAWIDKIKSIAGGKYWFYGSKEHFRLNDSGYWEWDQDGGIKTNTPSCLGGTRHFRVYAPPEFDDFYNPTFGYYVFGTSHYDHHELCNSWYDDSEGTELDVANLFAGKGYYTRYDYAWFYNQQYGDQGDHHWNNDGYATYVRVS